MKRLLLTLTFASIFISTFSQGVVTKLVEKYTDNTPYWFWHNLGSEHPQMKEMKKAISARKPAMQIVMQQINDLSSLRTIAKNSAISNPRYRKIIKYIYDITQIKDCYNDVEFFVINDSEENACMYPEGTGIIYSGIIDNSENIEEIIAVVAHEIAHYVLWHAINDHWRTAKAVRRNQMWADIGTGLAMATYGASQINNAQYGVQHSNEAQQQMYNNIAQAGQKVKTEIGIRTNIFTRLRYMRETEEEADETAFWFLEKNGIDPIHLINFFRKLDNAIPAEYRNEYNTKYSDHPDMAKRIHILEVLYKKYHNAKMAENPLVAQYKKSITESETNGNIYYLSESGIIHGNPNCKELISSKRDYRTIKIDQLKKMPYICKYCTEDGLESKILNSLPPEPFDFPIIK